MVSLKTIERTLAPTASGGGSWLSTKRKLVGRTPSWTQSMAMWEETDDYLPNPTQTMIHQRMLPDGGIAEALAVAGGIQSGKSMFTAAEIYRHLPFMEPLPGKTTPQPVFLMGPDYNQCKHEMRYLEHWCIKTGLLRPSKCVKPQSNDAWIFTLENGVRIQTFSARNPSAFAGESPGIVALVEAGQITQEAYWIARARSVPGNALFLMNGTIEKVEHDWYISVLERWGKNPTRRGIAYQQPSWTNLRLFPGGRHDEKIRAFEDDPTIPSAVFKARFAGEYVKPPGIVYAEVEELVHCRPIHLGAPLGVELPPWHIVLPKATPLELWIDPGWDHHGVVLCVAVVGDGHERMVYVLDEIAERHWQPSRFIHECSLRPWWPNVQRVIMDLGGTQHHGELTWRDMWQLERGRGGGGLPVLAQPVPIRESEMRCHALLEIDKRTDAPHVYFNSERTPRLLLEMTKLYKNHVDEQGHVIGPVPIDRDNDAVKAFQYGIWKHFAGDPSLTASSRAQLRVMRRNVPWEDVLDFSETALDHWTYDREGVA